METTKARTEIVALVIGVTMALVTDRRVQVIAAFMVALVASMVAGGSASAGMKFP